MISAIVLALVAHLSLSHAQSTAAEAPAPSTAVAPAPASAVISLLKAADANASLNPCTIGPRYGRVPQCCSGAVLPLCARDVWCCLPKSLASVNLIPPPHVITPNMHPLTALHLVPACAQDTSCVVGCIKCMICWAIVSSAGHCVILNSSPVQPPLLVQLGSLSRAVAQEGSPLILRNGSCNKSQRISHKKASSSGQNLLGPNSASLLAVTGVRAPPTSRPVPRKA